MPLLYWKVVVLFSSFSFPWSNVFNIFKFKCFFFTTIHSQVKFKFWLLFLIWFQSYVPYLTDCDFHALISILPKGLLLFAKMFLTTMCKKGLNHWAIIFHLLTFFLYIHAITLVSHERLKAIVCCTSLTRHNLNLILTGSWWMYSSFVINDRQHQWCNS